MQRSFDREYETQDGVMAAASTSGGGGGGVWEIEHEEDEIREVSGDDVGGDVPRHPIERPKFVDADDVYVAVGKGSSSAAALSWALKHAAKPTGYVYLVHVFPEVHDVPTPLGNMPKGQLSPAQVESYMVEVRMKRREMLQKFIGLCEASKVNSDTCLIESDQIVKAVLELIPVLHIRKLIVGTSKSNFRKQMRGNSKAVQIQKNAPGFCEVKIICEGKEVAPDQSPMSSPLPHTNTTNTTAYVNDFHSNTEEIPDNTSTCTCFSGKFL